MNSVMCCKVLQFVIRRKADYWCQDKVKYSFTNHSQKKSSSLYHYSIISFDSPPTHPILCVVFSIAQSSATIFLLVTGTREDSWEGYSFPNANHDMFLPPIIYKDVLYCMDSNKALGTYDLRRYDDLVVF